jgi:hypothetical protein
MYYPLEVSFVSNHIFSYNFARSLAESVSFDEDAVAPAAMIFPCSFYTNHDVLIEPGYRLGDSEGSRAFVRFAKKCSCSLTATRSSRTRDLPCQL